MSHEEIQQALDQFAAAENKQMTETLLFPIREIARTGSVCYKWQSLVGVLLHQLQAKTHGQILQSDNMARRAAGEEEPAGLAGDGSYEESCNRLYSLLQSFEGPPFTIQRFCELLLQPHQHHKTKRKLLHALDKLLSVTTIVAEQSLPPPPAPDAKVHELGLANHAAGDMEATGGAAAGGCSAGAGAARTDRELSDDTPMGDNLTNGFASAAAAAAAVASAEAGPGGAATGPTGEDGAESMQTEARPAGDGLEDSAMAA